VFRDSTGAWLGGFVWCLGSWWNFEVFSWRSTWRGQCLCGNFSNQQVTVTSLSIEESAKLLLLIYRHTNKIDDWLANHALSLSAGISSLIHPPAGCVNPLWRDVAGVYFNCRICMLFGGREV